MWKNLIFTVVSEQTHKWTSEEARYLSQGFMVLNFEPNFRQIPKISGTTIFLEIQIPEKSNLLEAKYPQKQKQEGN